MSHARYIIVEFSAVGPRRQDGRLFDQLFGRRLRYDISSEIYGIGSGYRDLSRAAVTLKSRIDGIESKRRS